MNPNPLLGVLYHRTGGLAGGGFYVPCRGVLSWVVLPFATYAFCAAVGITWYFQFFFYTMGESQMGAYGFSSWTMHMASIIIFSTLWGVALHKWKGAGPRTKRLLTGGLALLVLSTVIVGYGNHLGSTAAH